MNTSYGPQSFSGAKYVAHSFGSVDSVDQCDESAF